ncbi:MAG: NAD(P)H-hydrate dehydratase [Candidatus Omnitrophota bacterium]
MQLPVRLFNRESFAHKGDFGHVFILAGSECLMGAACLCSQSAMRSGAGLVTLGIPRSLHSIASLKLTEVMTLPLPETRQAALGEKALSKIKAFLKKADCLLMGPGLSRQADTQRLIRRVLALCDKPVCLDADALIALAGHLDTLKRIKNTAVLTPHPGEMAYLLGIPVKEVQNNRKKVAKEFALRYNTILVLKGHQTIVASPDGMAYINNTGNPGMATAGSGDVLAGMLAAFLGQGMPPYQAACSAVYVHGLAGDLAVRDKTEVSLIASDIIEYLPKAFKKLSTTMY